MHNVKQNSIIHVLPSLNLYWEHIFLDTAVYNIYLQTHTHTRTFSQFIIKIMVNHLIIAHELKMFYTEIFLKI